MEEGESLELGDVVQEGGWIWARWAQAPREQLSRQFYSTPIFTLPSENNVYMITCELWVTI